MLKKLDSGTRQYGLWIILTICSGSTNRYFRTSYTISNIGLCICLSVIRAKVLLSIFRLRPFSRNTENSNQISSGIKQNRYPPHLIYSEFPVINIKQLYI